MSKEGVRQRASVKARSRRRSCPRERARLRIVAVAAEEQKRSTAKDAQRRAVVLGPRPFQNVERAVRIEARLAQHIVPGEFADFRFGTQELQKIGLDLRSEIAGFFEEGAAVERGRARG